MKCQSLFSGDSKKTISIYRLLKRLPSMQNVSRRDIVLQSSLFITLSCLNVFEII